MIDPKDPELVSVLEWLKPGALVKIVPRAHKTYSLWSSGHSDDSWHTERVLEPIHMPEGTVLLVAEVLVSDWVSARVVHHSGTVGWMTMDLTRVSCGEALEPAT